MTIYFSSMRIKDEIKQKALFQATVTMVNQIGFAASSVSKIAREAGISPASLYVYHKNKEDLLVSTYIQIKKLMGSALQRQFDAKRPIRDILEQVWQNVFLFVTDHSDYFQYMEQFASSPYSDLVNKQEVEAYFEPVIQVIHKGIEQKIIKDVSLDIITAFVFQPVLALASPRRCEHFELNRENIDTAFNLAWDAIRR